MRRGAQRGHTGADGQRRLLTPPANQRVDAWLAKKYEEKRGGQREDADTVDGGGKAALRGAEEEDHTQREPRSHGHVEARVGRPAGYDGDECSGATTPRALIAINSTATAVTTSAFILPALRTSLVDYRHIADTCKGRSIARFLF